MPGMKASRSDFPLDRIGRRGALGALLGLAATFVLPRAWGVRSGVAPALEGDIATARYIGRQYLAMVPEEADVDRLIGLLAKGAGGENPMAASGWRQHIARVRQDEFASSETVLVDGWILARCEARVCALTALG